MEINKRQFNKWIRALRSGEFKQSKFNLQSTRGFCCLGVACKVLIPEKKLVKNERGLMYGGLPCDQEHAPKWLQDISQKVFELTEGNKVHGIHLTDFNDKKNLSFDEIADILELLFIHNAGPLCEVEET